MILPQLYNFPSLEWQRLLQLYGWSALQGRLEGWQAGRVSEQLVFQESICDLSQIWDADLARWRLVRWCLGGWAEAGLGSVLLEQRKLLPGDKQSKLSPSSSQGRVVANVMEGQALHFRWGDGAKFQCTELKDCFKQGSIGRQRLPHFWPQPPYAPDFSSPPSWPTLG